MLARLRSFARAAIGRRALERGFADEMRFHVEARVADLVARGVSPAEAAARARREFGSVTLFEDGCRDARGLRVLDDLAADLRYGVRVLLRAPGFTLMAVASLALGIGANTVVFSVVNALVLSPLPIASPERVVFLQGSRGHASISFPNYRDVRDRASSFDGLAGYRISPMNMDAGGTPLRTWGYLATGNYFDVLGVKPALGRFFHQDDDLHEGQPPLAVLSYSCWAGRFGADPSAVGRTVRLNSTRFTIIGVAPDGFRGTELFYQPDLWVPMMLEPRIEVGNPWLDLRNTSNTWVVGRLKPDVTPAAAAADLNTIAAGLAREYPREDDGLSFTLARPGLVGDTLGAPVRAFTIGVLALAALVLFAACVNLAGVLAARGADRQRELAIRISIGAGRGRIVRQLLTETLLLAGAGGAAGCALAFGAARALTAWRAPVDVPIQFDIPVDGRVLLFACGASVAAGLLFGLAPARQAARTDPQRALKDAPGGDRPRAGVRRWPLRDLLVAVQVAISVVLVCASVLALRGLQHAMNMAMGLDPRGVTVAGFDLGLGGYSREAGAGFQRRALDAVRALPGVQSAAYSNSLPLSIDQSTSGIYPDDQPGLRTADVHSALVYEISPGFLQTLGIRRELGRDIDWHDTAGRPRVAIVNRTFARTIMRTADPVGRHFAYGWRADPVEIVGVVEDGKYEALTERPRPAVFEAIQQRYNATTTLLVKSTLPADEVVAAVRKAIATLDPALPVYMAGTVDQMLGFARFPSEAAAVALSVFGLLALVLAATGINGLVSYAVARRRREIGIRVAIGASRSNILRLVFGRIGVLMAAGAAAGLVLAAAAGRLLSGIVYEATARDPAVILLVAAIIVSVGILSSLAPARRSLEISPGAALRND